MASVATLRIKRPFRFSNLIRSYIVMLDGERVAKLWVGGEVEVPVGSGPHELYLKIDWCRSQPEDFTVSGNETITFEVGSVNPLVGIYYVIFDSKNFLSLRRVS